MCSNVRLPEHSWFISWLTANKMRSYFINWCKYPSKTELALLTALWLTGSVAAECKQVPTSLPTRDFPSSHTYPHTLNSAFFFFSLFWLKMNKYGWYQAGGKQIGEQEWAVWGGYTFIKAFGLRSVLKRSFRCELKCFFIEEILCVW